MSFELVLRVIGGIVAALGVSEFAGLLFANPEPNVPVDALRFSLASLGFAVGFAITPYATTVPFNWFRDRVLHASGGDFLAGALGLGGGLVCGALVHGPLAGLPGGLGIWLPAIASGLLGYLGVIAAVEHKHAVLTVLGGTREVVRGHELSAGERVLVDTSAIIDGRIAGVAETGFLFCTLVVPRFVLTELQQVADSSSAERRIRGRRGLDVLDELQKHSLAPVEIVDLDVDDTADVDSKLVRLARANEWALLTNDFNLNKVAALQGIRVLNLNELANKLKPTYLNGDVLRIKIVERGNQAGQGVGYLPEGTMVVVEGADQLVGQEADVIVTRSLQNLMGRMIFARPKARQDAAS
ncbi:MAG TPA: TRAM domain-containing protein [Chloroflexota bacterium]|nr:TRAM domain-containing protein [Chloroflexota bacterium]